MKSHHRHMLLPWQRGLIHGDMGSQGGCGSIIHIMDNDSYAKYETIIGIMDMNDRVHDVLTTMTPMGIQAYIEGNNDYEDMEPYTFMDLMYFIDSLTAAQFTSWKHMVLRYMRFNGNIMHDDAFLGLSDVATALFGEAWHETIPESFFGQDMRFGIDHGYSAYIIGFCRPIKDKALQWRLIRWFMSHGNGTIISMQHLLHGNRDADIAACIDHTMPVDPHETSWRYKHGVIPLSSCAAIANDLYVRRDYATDMFTMMFDAYMDAGMDESAYRNRLDAMSERNMKDDVRELDALYRTMHRTKGDDIIVRGYNIVPHTDIIHDIGRAAHSLDTRTMTDINDFLDMLDDDSITTPYRKAMRNDILFESLEHGAAYGKSIGDMMYMIHEISRRNFLHPDDRGALGKSYDGMECALILMNWMESDYRDIPMAAYREIMEINGCSLRPRTRRA